MELDPDDPQLTAVCRVPWVGSWARLGLVPWLLGTTAALRDPLAHIPSPDHILPKQRRGQRMSAHQTVRSNPPGGPVPISQMRNLTLREVEEFSLSPAAEGVEPEFRTNGGFRAVLTPG